MAETSSAPIRERSAAPSSWSGLRASEKIALVFFAYTALHAMVSLPLRERAILVSLNILVAIVIVVLSMEGRVATGPVLGALRDWLPCALIVLAYRESGLFLLPDLTHSLDHAFIQWDRALFANSWVRALVAAGSPWLERFFELCYLFTYPFVPLGFAAVYFARGGTHGDERAWQKDKDFFWTTVLLAVLVSYTLYPLFPLTPPRVLFHDLPWPASKPLLRGMNLWVLKYYSVQACIFPSGHVAGGVATALAVRARHPRLGALFLVAAASIAAATVFQRYHYTADAVAGALVGIAAFAFAALVHRKGA